MKIWKPVPLQKLKVMATNSYIWLKAIIIFPLSVEVRKIFVFSLCNVLWYWKRQQYLREGKERSLLHYAWTSAFKLQEYSLTDSKTKINKLPILKWKFLKDCQILLFSEADFKGNCSEMWACRVNTFFTTEQNFITAKNIGKFDISVHIFLRTPILKHGRFP